MKIIKNSPLVSYFILVFFIMYGLASIIIFSIFDVPEIILWFLGSSAPTISAIIISYICDGKKWIKKLFKPFFTNKVKCKWYFAWLAITLISTVIAISYLLINNLEIPSIDYLMLIPTIIMVFIMGPLVEESGWAGFAQPRLQSKFNALTASIVLWILWAVWHIPLWFLPGSAQSTMNFWLFLIVVVALRVIMGWAYNNTKGGIFIAVLFHFFFNLWNGIAVEILGVPMNDFLYIAWTALAIYAVWVVIVNGPKNLSKTNERIKI